MRTAKQKFTSICGALLLLFGCSKSFPDDPLLFQSLAFIQERTALDPAGILLDTGSGIFTSERLTSSQFTLALESRPTADVVLEITSSNTNEGVVNPASLTFSSNPDAPNAFDKTQPVTVTGVDDTINDGNMQYVIGIRATSGDTTYNALPPLEFTAVNGDNEVEGLTINPTRLFLTTESGGTDRFSIFLNTAPISDATLNMTLSDPSEGVLDPVSVVFTTADWSTSREVTIRGIDDTLGDGNQKYDINLAITSDDIVFNNLQKDISVLNLDNDNANITAYPSNGLTTDEGGKTDTILVVLNQRPESAVTVSAASDDPTEGSVSPANVIFTIDNWNSPQTLTVTGVDDLVQDSNVAYNIVTSAASDDPVFAAIDPNDAAVTNIDDDTAGFNVSVGGACASASLLCTDESGSTASFSVTLMRQPASNVTLSLAYSSASPATEATLSVPALTFTTTDWNSPHSAVVSGADDASIDGTQAYTITMTP